MTAQVSAALNLVQGGAQDGQALRSTNEEIMLHFQGTENELCQIVEKGQSNFIDTGTDWKFHCPKRDRGGEIC